MSPLGSSLLGSPLGTVIIGFSGYVMWFGKFFGKILPGWAPAPWLLSNGYDHLRRRRDRDKSSKETHANEYQRLAAKGKLEQKLTTKAPMWLMNFSK